MITQIVKMQVADFNKFKQMHDKLDQIQKQHGLDNGQIAVDPNDNTKITLIMNWQDIEQMKRYTESKEVAYVMQNAGLRGMPSIKVFQEI